MTRFCGLLRTWRIIACVSVVAGSAACGNDSLEIETGGNSNPAWISISNRNVDGSTLYVSGTAWVSERYAAYKCVGLACLADTWSTDNDPGVTVTWENSRTGETGSAGRSYGGATAWQHRWSAVIPLSTGTNTLRIKAYDPGGTGKTLKLSARYP